MVGTAKAQPNNSERDSRTVRMWIMIINQDFQVMRRGLIMLNKYTFCGLVIILCLLLNVAGCEEKKKDEVLDYGEKAKTSLARTQVELGEARKKIVQLEEMLDTVIDSRDEAEAKVTQLTTERDKAVNASAEAQRTVATLTAQLNQKTETEGFLTNEIKEWEAIVSNLQTTIAEQQGTIEALQEALEQPMAEQHQMATEETEDVPDPNEAAEEI